MPTTALNVWGAQRVEPFYDAEDARQQHVSLAPSQTLAKGTVLGEAFGTGEVQTFAITGGATGGTFTLTFSGQTTAAIPYNANADQVKEALELLSNIGEGGIVTSGGPVNVSPVIIQFVGVNLGTNVAQMTNSVASVTGGTPVGTNGTTTQGAAGVVGRFKAYNDLNTDGSQQARAILPYDCIVDGSGNITLSSTAAQAGADQGQTMKTVPVYYSGTFNTADLVGLDPEGVADLGRLVSGTVAAGILRIG